MLSYLTPTIIFHWCRFPQHKAHARFAQFRQPDTASMPWTLEVCSALCSISIDSTESKTCTFLLTCNIGKIPILQNVIQWRVYGSLLHL